MKGKQKKEKNGQKNDQEAVVVVIGQDVVTSGQSSNKNCSLLPLHSRVFPTFASCSSSAVQDGESDAKDERIEKGEKEGGKEKKSWRQRQDQMKMNGLFSLERRKKENRKEEE